LGASRRQTMLVAGLVTIGLVAGWVVSGLFTPPEEAAVAAGAARVTPTDFRALGPDE
jgi:hypothetical protein